jgi:hypothetical protein
MKAIFVETAIETAKPSEQRVALQSLCDMVTASQAAGVAGFLQQCPDAVVVEALG